MKKFLATTAILLITASASRSPLLHLPLRRTRRHRRHPGFLEAQRDRLRLEATSPDEGTYISFDVAGAEDMEQVISDVFAFLEENGVTPDPASQTESKGEQNGMAYQTLSWKGTDKEGPVTIGVGVVTLSPEKIAIVTYWASAETEEANNAEVNKILESIKPAG